MLFSGLNLLKDSPKCLKWSKKLNICIVRTLEQELTIGSNGILNENCVQNIKLSNLIYLGCR